MNSSQIVFDALDYAEKFFDLAAEVFVFDASHIDRGSRRGSLIAVAPFTLTTAFDPHACS